MLNLMPEKYKNVPTYLFSSTNLYETSYLKKKYVGSNYKPVLSEIEKKNYQHQKSYYLKNNIQLSFNKS